MKRLLVMILFMFLLTGCGHTNDFQKSKTFICVQKADNYHNYDIVYHKDTKVMYVVSHDTYSQGIFTLLVNPDGSPMLYEAESEDTK